MNDQIYAIGGRRGSESWQIMNNVERYSPVSDTWERIKGMNVQRSKHSAATLQGYIYSCGGQNHQTSCERYSPANNSWSFVSEMQKGRYSFASVGDGNRVYAVGGCGTANVEKRVEMYYPENNNWLELKTQLMKKRCV